MFPMLGWNIGVHRFADPELRSYRGDLDSIRTLIAARTDAVEVPRATAEDPQVAGWQAGLVGVYWLDELVDAGKGAHTMRGGRPESYLIRCEDLRTRLRAGLPNVAVREVEGCDAEEWLLVEAWHETDQHASARAAGGGEQ